MRNKVLLYTLLFVACFQSAIAASNYDFEFDHLYYQITSDNTVAIAGIDNSFYENYYYIEVYDIVIPSHVTNNSSQYIVTAIADSAFYNQKCIGRITVPETVTSIGLSAFLECTSGLIIKCLSLSPPTINDSFDSVFILLVHEEAYNLYQESYGDLGIFNHILSFDVPQSPKPTCSGYYYGIHKGCVLVFDNYGENIEIYERHGWHSTTDGWANVNWEFGGWNRFIDHAIINCSGLHATHHYRIESFVIVNNHFYDDIFYDDDYGEEGFYTMGETYDIINEEILYSFSDGSDAALNNDYLGYPLELKLNVSYNGFDYGLSYYVALSYYAGEIVIPTSVHFAIWDYDIVGIVDNAFLNCVDLNSVTIPSSVQKIGAAFGNCPNLSFIKCLGITPASASQYSFDDGVYQNTTLYVPNNAIEAYRNAPGWCYFQNIVGFYDYDFELDGLYYKITGDGEVALTAGPDAYCGNVTVPTEVTNDGVTYTVTSIADGAFADAVLTNLYLPVTIASVGSDTFSGCQVQSLYLTGIGAWQTGGLNLHVTNLFIGSGVLSLTGLQVGATAIYCYATQPPQCDNQSFLDYDAVLHVPASAIAAYFTAPYWCNFLNITGNAIEVTELTLSESNIELLAGDQVTLSVTVKPTNAMPAVVAWSSTNDAVATVVDGVVTAVAGGDCDIIATCQSMSAVCHVVVTEIPPTGISISQEYAKMEIGGQLTLTATVLPEDATNKTITWLSDNEAVATVNDGVVSAVGTGECNITAYCGEFQATCHVVVLEHLVYITLDKHEAELLPNHIITLIPTATPVSTDLVVTSSDPSVAAARLAGGVIQVVGIKEGSSWIIVNSADGYAEPDSCEVIVYTEYGDLNCDGYVDINDVTAMIDQVLGNNPPVNLENADLNFDGGIDIVDITELIDVLLGNSQLPPKDHNAKPYTVNGVTFKMVKVKGGTFSMGATPEQGDEARDNEKPVHQVTVSDFNIGQTEVTQELWLAVMGSNPSNHTGDMKRPVDMVSWEDCQEFISRLNQLTGKQFRLPTEAEWEYAARGGSKSHGTRYAGSDNIDEVAWYNLNSGDSTHPVATKARNELGLYDMTGNVWEWCSDWYSRYTADAQTNPTGPETGSYRVLRGGCWNGNTNYDRISFRDYFMPTGSNNSGGLRLVMDEIEVYTVNGVSFSMVPVKGGTFSMGATVETDSNASEIESPIHDVTMSDYRIAQTEVTQELWLAVMGSNPSNHTGDLQLPVENVNYEDCQAFIAALNDLTGENFRLPTEAEWEYAARGGNLSHRYMYSGSDDIDEVAWYKGNSDLTTHPVGTKKANELGLYDMSGNVCEWCGEWFSLYSAEPQTNPTGPETGMSRVHRGGSMQFLEQNCAVTRRNYFSPGIVRAYMGLRLVK